MKLAATVFGNPPKNNITSLRTIDFGDLGLGDNLMAWAGLHALLSNGFPPTARDCVLYVPRELAGLATSVFSRYDIHVEGVQLNGSRRQRSPVFTASPPVKLWDWCKTFVGPDWRMNCFEALDAQKTISCFDKSLKARDRVRLALSERILYRRQGWKAAVAEYVGYRLWRPLARKMGILPVPFLTLVKRSLPSLRADVSRHVDERSTRRDSVARFAIFPAGKSFQAFPASACKLIQERLPKDQTVFYIEANDPWIADYHNAGLNPRTLESVEDSLWVIKTARNVMTTDSFSSHVAQFLRDDFVLALTRDFRENIVHPGAHPIIVANHPPCAPCSYVTRADSRVCSANHTSCMAFENARYPRDLAKALLSLSTNEDQPADN